MNEYIPVINGDLIETYDANTGARQCINHSCVGYQIMGQPATDSSGTVTVAVKNPLNGTISTRRFDSKTGVNC